MYTINDLNKVSHKYGGETAQKIKWKKWLTLFPYVSSTICYSELHRLASITIKETHFDLEGSKERY